MDDLLELDATATAALVHAGDVTPTELVEAAVRRVEALDGPLNAVVHERFDRALDEARRVDPAAPFAGVPIVVKDYDGPLADEPFHGGMRFLRRLGFRERVDSHMVTRLRAAGFVVIGKTNTPELGLQATTEPVAYGPTRNPWDPSRSTGGSSGGSAAAVAAGMVPIAHGGDGGGSLRIPAGACGLVGLKPTRGRVSLGPLEGENWAGFVSRHVLTRTVRDSARALDLLAGREPGDPTGLPRPTAPFLGATRTGGPRLRIGVVDRLPGSGDLSAPACQRAVADTAEALTALGHTVEWSRPPAFDEASIVADLTTVVAVWVDHELRTWEGRAGAQVDPAELEVGTRGFAALGAAVTTSSYLAAVDRLHAWSRSLERWWTHDGHDLMLTPTTPVPAPSIGAVPASVSEEDPAGLNALLVAFTAPFNISGQPAISVPGTPTSDGRPVGVQLAAAWGREDLLLRAAAELEEAAPWPLTAPLSRFTEPAPVDAAAPTAPSGDRA